MRMSEKYCVILRPIFFKISIQDMVISNFSVSVRQNSTRTFHLYRKMTVSTVVLIMMFISGPKASNCRQEICHRFDSALYTKVSWLLPVLIGNV